MALSDFPELAEAFWKLQGQKDEIEASVEPLREEYRTLQAELAPQLEQLRQLGERMRLLQEPLTPICMQLSRIAKVTGGKALSDATLRQQQGQV